MRYIPQAAIDFIRNAEGCRLHIYPDSAGKLTIGIGHLIKPCEEFGIITYQEAEDLLRDDMQEAANAIARLITRPLNDNQYAALLSFTYNEGGGTLQRSTLRRKCNRGEDDDVPQEFMKYVYVKDTITKIPRKVTGLIHRRAAEARLYMA
jgi:lysozyme